MIFIKNKLGLLHSIDDKPSLIDDDDNKYWHKDGRLHRDNDLPAIIMGNGDKYWYINGAPSRLDNIDLPYIEMSNGDKYYRLENGGYKKISKRREDWFNKNNEYHRDNEPAVIDYYENGNIKDKAYCINGNFHRENDYALITYFKNGDIEYQCYYLNGVPYSKENYLKTIKAFKSCNKIP
jgi:antitoxin component YwqK of YwqJK toxin-antitoxin module